jgi:hypothetical protein
LVGEGLRILTLWLSQSLFRELLLCLDFVIRIGLIMKSGLFTLFRNCCSAGMMLGKIWGILGGGEMVSSYISEGRVLFLLNWFLRF